MKKNVKSKIPNFKTYKEEAHFWDTHDITDFESETEDVKIVFDLKKPRDKTLVVRLQDEFKKKLEKSGIQLGGQKDLCQDFNKKQAEEKGLKTRDPGTKGLSITFSF